MWALIKSILEALQISDSFEESDDDPFEKPEYVKHREMCKPPLKPVSSAPKENDEGFFSSASSPPSSTSTGDNWIIVRQIGADFVGSSNSYTGVIDSYYEGELKVMASTTLPWKVSKGDRITQLPS